MKTLLEFLVKGKISKISKNDKTFQVYRYPGFDDYYVAVYYKEDMHLLCNGKVPDSDIKDALNYVKDNDKKGIMIRLVERPNCTVFLVYTIFNKTDLNDYEYIENIQASDFTVDYWKNNKWSVKR